MLISIINIWRDKYSKTKKWLGKNWFWATLAFLPSPGWNYMQKRRRDKKHGRLQYVRSAHVNENNELSAINDRILTIPGGPVNVCVLPLPVCP